MKLRQRTISDCYNVISRLLKMREKRKMNEMLMYDFLNSKVNDIYKVK